MALRGGTTAVNAVELINVYDCDRDCELVVYDYLHYNCASPLACVLTYEFASALVNKISESLLSSCQLLTSLLGHSCPRGH